MKLPHETEDNASIIHGVAHTEITRWLQPYNLQPCNSLVQPCSNLVQGCYEVDKVVTRLFFHMGIIAAYRIISATVDWSNFC